MKQILIEHQESPMTLDEALAYIPVGYFHYRILFICGMTFIANGMEVSLLSFISTCAGQDWDLNTSEISLIASVVFGGQLVGTVFWGPLADSYGRRIAFICGSVLISGAGFASGFSPNYAWLLILRGLVGFGLGGATVPFDILAEFTPASHRGMFLIFIEYFWTLGSLLVSTLAWTLLDSQGWKFLTILTAIPVAISCLGGIPLLPESPRWLLVQGRRAEVLNY